MGVVYVLGAGLAGLAAAERLSSQGAEVVMLEASPKAGGRCRSYRDDRLGRVIDNGNHLILSANRTVLDYADRIGGADKLKIGAAEFPFLDLGGGTEWTIAPGSGPWGALGKAARPPGVTIAKLAADTVRLLTAGPDHTVADRVSGARAMTMFWDPMTRAVLNEAPETGSAALLRAAFLRSFAKGGASARPVFAPDGLGAALVDPALEVLKGRGIVPRYRMAVTGLIGHDRLEAIETAQDRIMLGPEDRAILAVPARQGAQLLPWVTMPPPGQAILNAHFLCPDSNLPPLMALIGGHAHWLFRRDDVVSVTVSAEEASPLAGLPRGDALALLWRDVARAISHRGGVVPDHVPPARLLREKAATFDQSPAGVAQRPHTRTNWANLFLAGDHVRTGLPATIEGAVRSGLAAARMALG